MHSYNLRPCLVGAPTRWGLRALADAGAMNGSQNASFYFPHYPSTDNLGHLKCFKAR